MMKHFFRKVISYKSLIIFATKLHCRCLTWSQMRFWLALQLSFRHIFFPTFSNKSSKIFKITILLNIFALAASVYRSRMNISTTLSLICPSMQYRVKIKQKRHQNHRLWLWSAITLFTLNRFLPIKLLQSSSKQSVVNRMKTLGNQLHIHKTNKILEKNWERIQL